MTNQDSQDHTIKVTIHGQEYPIRGHGDEDYIRRVAQYVDERMAQIEERTSINTPVRLAILAALNIADELFALQKEKDRILSEFEEKTRALTEHLNQGLSQV